MQLVLFTILGLIVAINGQAAPPAPTPKAGVCPPRTHGWTLGPRPFTSNSHKEAPIADQEGNNLEKPSNFNMFPFGSSGLWFRQPWWPMCDPQCTSDADCTGTLKCCGSHCNTQCIPPLEYDEKCGLVPTEAYCTELCAKKTACNTTPGPGCRNYNGHCVPFCKKPDECYGGKCCRNLRCSYTCKGYRYGFGHGHGFEGGFGDFGGGFGGHGGFGYPF